MGKRKVKSGGRVIEILDLFARERRALSATEICKQLDYPKSSANMLLHTLVDTGMLSLGSDSINFFPTLKVTRLGDWLPGMLLGGEDVSAVVQELQIRTQETTTLSIPNGTHMEFVRVHVGTHPIALNIDPGALVPILGTAVGIAYLSTQTDDAIERLFEKAHAEGVLTGANLEPGQLMAEILAARKNGYTVGYDRLISDTGAIAVPINSSKHDRGIVLGVGGLSSRIKRNEQKILKVIMALAQKASASIDSQQNDK